MEQSGVPDQQRQPIHQNISPNSCLSFSLEGPAGCLSACLPVLILINKFKGTQRAKAEWIRPSREGRRGAAAFTVSHESLQPTVLDICHTHSLLSFFPSHSVFLRPTEARGQPARSIWLLPPPETGNTVGLVNNTQMKSRMG